MVEGTGLENRHTGNGIVSSNLTLSAACGNAPATNGHRGVSTVPSWLFLRPAARQNTSTQPRSFACDGGEVLISACCTAQLDHCT